MNPTSLILTDCQVNHVPQAMIRWLADQAEPQRLRWDSSWSWDLTRDQWLMLMLQWAEWVPGDRTPCHILP